MLRKISALLAISLIVPVLAACASTSQAAAPAAVESAASTTPAATTTVAPTVTSVVSELEVGEADATEAPVENLETEAAADEVASAVTYPLVETGQGFCYDDDGQNTTCPAEDEAFYGQDAQFTGNAFSYTDNGDGTVTDNVTGLVWQQTPDGNPYSWEQAQSYCESLTLGGQDDWRMPTLKELFSISDFSAGWPYLDTDYFDLAASDSISKDEQYWADNTYVGYTSEGRYDAAFGVNHATGHIKAYPALVTGPMGKYVRCVCGDEYGINDFVDNSNGTITDEATGLMWTQADSGEGMDWEAALAYAQEMNDANYLGYSDWRLPNVKELQSIADYDYAPDAEDAAYDGPALDPMFSVSEITNEAGESDYPYYWTSTSARFQSTGDFYYAWYVAAGRAVDGSGADSHGAGAVRFDTKVEGGPAGEGGERVYNYVRLVRGGYVTETPDGDSNANDTAPELAFAGGGGPGGAPEGAPEGGPEDRPEDGAPADRGGAAPGGQEIDLAAAALVLGVTEQELEDALGGPPPDFTAAAEILEVSEEELFEALGIEAGGPPTGGQPPADRP